MTPQIAMVFAFAGASVSLLFGIYVIHKNPKRKINITFFGLLLVTSFWLFSYAKWQTTNNAVDALLWLKILMVGAIYTYPLLVHFVNAFAHSVGTKWVVVGSYISAPIVAYS